MFHDSSPGGEGSLSAFKKMLTYSAEIDFYSVRGTANMTSGHMWHARRAPQRDPRDCQIDYPLFNGGNSWKVTCDQHGSPRGD